MNFFKKRFGQSQSNPKTDPNPVQAPRAKTKPQSKVFDINDIPFGFSSTANLSEDIKQQVLELDKQIQQTFASGQNIVPFEAFHKKGELLRNNGDKEMATQTFDYCINLLKLNEAALRQQQQWASLSQILHMQFQFTWAKPPYPGMHDEVDQIMEERLKVAKLSKDSREIASAMLGQAIRTHDITLKMERLRAAQTYATNNACPDIAGQAGMQITVFSMLDGTK